MSILDEQLIGEGKLTGNPDVPPLKRNPFSAGDTDGEQVPVGFGGYTYAKDEDQQGVFKTTVTRTGPLPDVTLNQGSSPTQYGPDGRRMSDSQTTLLGQMAEMIKPRKEGEADPTWNTEGGGAKMGHTFTSSDELKSFKDHTITGGAPTASGGYSGGFDANNNYGITNWLAGGGTGIAAQAEIEEVSVPWLDPNTNLRNAATIGPMGADGMNAIIGRHKGNWGDENSGDFVLTEAQDAVAMQPQDESFRSGGSSTGLRNMPESPTS